MCKWRSSWQAVIAMHPARVFTVGYFIFMYEQWGPRHVCTSVTRTGVFSRAEFFFPFIFFCFKGVLNINISLFCSDLFSMAECRFCYSRCVFKLFHFSKSLLLLRDVVTYNDRYAHTGFCLVISSLEWAYRPTSRVVCSIYRYSGPKNNAYSNRE